MGTIIQSFILDFIFPLVPTILVLLRGCIVHVHCTCIMIQILILTFLVKEIGLKLK